jgi:hypothetical protein
MKSIKIILLAIIISQLGYAQDPQLFENTWYIQKVILDGNEHERPYETFDGHLILSLDELNLWHEPCDEGFGSPIQYDISNNTFNINDGGVGIIGVCVDPDIINFMNNHYSVYLIDNNFARNPFTYVLETVNDHTSLTIINADGDQAIYGDALLSIDEFTQQSISVYPNPAQDVITIEKNNRVEITAIKLYDALGRLVLAVMGDVNQIDVSSFTSGVFLIKIETDKGVIVKKIIKE